MRVVKVLRFICYPMRVQLGTVSFKTDFSNFSIYSTILYRCVVAVMFPRFGLYLTLIYGVFIDYSPKLHCSILL